MENSYLSDFSSGDDALQLWAMLNGSLDPPLMQDTQLENHATGRATDESTSQGRWRQLEDALPDELCDFVLEHDLPVPPTPSCSGIEPGIVQHGNGDECSSKTSSFVCTTCQKTFANRWNLKRHSKIHEQTRYECPTCGKVFSREDNAIPHMKECKGEKYECDKCSHCSYSLTALRQHITKCHPKKKNRVVKTVKCGRSKSRGGGYVCSVCRARLTSRGELYRHRMTQHGRGDQLQPEPWNEEERPWNDENNRALEEEYNINRTHILRSHLLDARVRSEYNFPTNNLNGGVDELMRYLEEIFQKEVSAFRINLAFGFILQHREDQETYRYYIPYSNASVFDSPLMISRRRDLERLRRQLEILDIENHVTKQRQDTKWKVRLITNVVFFVYRTDYTLGQGELPDFVRSRGCIISLERGKNGVYRDNLCVFRCLGVHRQQKRLESAVKTYYGKWKEYMHNLGRELPGNMKDFEGISFSDLPYFERCFEVQITVCELQEDGNAIPKHHPTTRYQDVMYMNVFKQHLSYIKDFRVYAHKFQCPMCDRHFPRLDLIKRHLKTCNNNTKLIYPGGVHQPLPNVFQKLEEFGVIVPKAERFFSHFAVYDFEAVLEKTEEQSGQHSKWTARHRPVSVSVCSNIPAHTEPQTFVEEDLEVLLNKMVGSLQVMSEVAEKLARERWNDVLVQLEELIQVWKPVSCNEDEDDGDDHNVNSAAAESRVNEPPSREFLQAMSRPNSYRNFQERLHSNGEWNVQHNSFSDDDDDDSMADGEEDQSDQQQAVESTVMYKTLLRLKGSFLDYCSQLPVLGFNSSKYDLNLIKSKLAKCLNLSSSDFVVKRNNTYLCIGCRGLKFLDITQYLAPGCSYSKFLNAYGVTEQKSYFPYEWFDNAEKLKHSTLPDYVSFYSQLKGYNVLEEEFLNWEKSGMSDPAPPSGQEKYQELQSLWVTKGMASFADFLKFYNEQDVKPFVTAVEKFLQFYKEKEIDVFKVAISVPGVARHMLFQAAREKGVTFSLFPEEDKDLSMIVKKNIVGGPSIIFHRQHVAGQTQLRDCPEKVCQRILGYDANALYLWAIGQAMPVGNYARYLAEGCGFKCHFANPKFMTMFYWMDSMALQNNVNIQHKLNVGKEHRVGPYLVDGLDVENNHIYEFHGCYWHGHDCEDMMKKGSDKWKERQPKLLKRTQERTQFLRSKGYTVTEMWECDYNRRFFVNVAQNGVRDKYMPPFARDNLSFSEESILQAVRDGEFFGMVECDIEVPKEWNAEHQKEMSPRDYFREMAPIFCTNDVPFDVIGSHMQQHVESHGLSKKPRKLLVGGMAAKKIMLASPLLKWYLDHGIKVTQIYQCVEFNQSKCFESFQKEVSEARRDGDRDKSKAILAETWKLIGNSSYGSLIMEKQRHRDIKYLQGEVKAKQAVNSPRFLSLTELGDDCYEVESAKAAIRLDLPITLGYFILQYAKLRMLQFYYDFLDEYIDRSDFELCEMDTDSLYFAVTGNNIEDVLKPEKVDDYRRSVYQSCSDSHDQATQQSWFPRKCCQKHICFDKRTSGLFKLEAEGTRMTCLTSKTYVSEELDGQHKISSKGINKSRITDPMTKYNSVLETQKSVAVTNIGFRARQNGMCSYQQERTGFSYYYCKRAVEDDGVRTRPLDLVLSPWPTDCVVFDSIHLLGMNHRCEMIKDNKTFYTASQLFNYEKALFHHQEETASLILNGKGIGAAKLGASIKCSADWYLARDDVMQGVLLSKAQQTRSVRDLLMYFSKKRLVYVDRFSKYWGCGFPSVKLAKLCEPKQFPGVNRLGMLWEKVRKMDMFPPEHDNDSEEEMEIDEAEDEESAEEVKRCRNCFNTNVPLIPEVRNYICQRCFNIEKAQREQAARRAQYNAMGVEPGAQSCQECGCAHCKMIESGEKGYECLKCGETDFLEDEYFEDRRHYCIFCREEIRREATNAYYGFIEV